MAVRKIVCVMIAIGAALLGLLSASLYFSTDSAFDTTKEALPVFALHSLQSKTPDMQSAQLQHPAILHFFASWCHICEQDHRWLQELIPHYTLYGIVMADQRNKALEWLEEHGDPYKAIGFDSDQHSVKLFGLTGLPETIATDKTGKVIAHIRGALSESSVAKLVVAAEKGAIS